MNESKQESESEKVCKKEKKYASAVRARERAECIGQKKKL